MRLAATALAILSAGGALVALDRWLAPARAIQNAPSTAVAGATPGSRPEVLWTTEPRVVVSTDGLRRLPDRERAPGGGSPPPVPPALAMVTPAPEPIPLRDLDDSARRYLARESGRSEEAARDRRARRQARWDASPWPRQQAWRDRPRSASAAFERSPNYDLMGR